LVKAFCATIGTWDGEGGTRLFRFTIKTMLR
jgi:hypothetical protein